MFAFRLRAAAFAMAGGLALGACAYDDGYGYGGVEVGYTATYYDPYYQDPYWAYYRSRPYWGWYDGYYYPGTGVYVYDSYRRPHRWNDRYRQHWVERRGYWQGRDRRREWRENWRDFDRDRREWRGDRRGRDGRDWRRDRRDRDRDRDRRRWRRD